MHILVGTLKSPKIYGGKMNSQVYQMEVYPKSFGFISPIYVVKSPWKSYCLLLSVTFKIDQSDFSRQVATF